MLYLKLYNGRYNLAQSIEDFGFTRPGIGPLKSVHCSGSTHVMLAFVNEADAMKFGIDPKLPVLKVHDEMLHHQMPGEPAVLYGDWTVYLQAGTVWSVCAKPTAVNAV